MRHLSMIVALSVLLTLTLPVCSPTTSDLAGAQDSSAIASATAKSQAATLLNQIQVALQAMKQEFGQSVFINPQRDLSSSAHGNETIAEAWNRNLTAAGVTSDLSQREALARSIGLDPQASLVLVAGLARYDAIEYLQSQLRRVSEGP